MSDLVPFDSQRMEIKTRPWGMRRQAKLSRGRSREWRGGAGGAACIALVERIGLDERDRLL